MLYPGYDNNVAGGCLAWLGIASIFVCIMLLSLSFYLISLYFEGRQDTIRDT